MWVADGVISGEDRAVAFPSATNPNGRLVYISTPTDVQNTSKPLLCDKAVQTTTAQSAMELNEFRINNSTNNRTFWYFVIPPSAGVTTEAEANAWLANNSYHFFYYLATPFTVQLAPQQIKTLLGQNNIWADTGDVSVDYRADTKMYIDKKFAELQALVLEN